MTKQNSQVNTEEKHRHHWEDSRLFFIGQLYSRIYPRYCECGAFMKVDGTIIEPKKPKEVKHG